jgi:conjugal transfer/entry exclusion protein
MRRTAAVTAEAVQDFKVMLRETTDDLQTHLSDLGERLEALKIQDANTKDENIAERKRMQAEIDSTRKCLVVCAQVSEHAETVRTNVFEDVSAARDAHMVIVSTVGELISAKRVTADIRATQILGQMSNTSLQQLASSRGVDLEDISRRARDTAKENGGSVNFEDQYGSGHKLR